jgi:hypothetical protein
MLGDLTNGAKADPNLTQFGAALTNNHNLATQFVTLDNFMNRRREHGRLVLGDAGRVTPPKRSPSRSTTRRSTAVCPESEGENRNVAVNFATVAERDASGPAGTTNYSTASATLPGGTVNLLAGARNHASADALFGSRTAISSTRC